MSNCVAALLGTGRPLLPGFQAAWKPSFARGVTQMRSCGITPSTIVQADKHGPSMMTRSPELFSAARFSRYGPICPPGSETIRTAECAVVTASAAMAAPTRTAIRMLPPTPSDHRRRLPLPGPTRHRMARRSCEPGHAGGRDRIGTHGEIRAAHHEHRAKHFQMVEIKHREGL